MRWMTACELALSRSRLASRNTTCAVEADSVRSFSCSLRTASRSRSLQLFSLVFWPSTQPWRSLRRASASTSRFASLVVRASPALLIDFADSAMLCWKMPFLFSVIAWSRKSIAALIRIGAKSCAPASLAFWISVSDASSAVAARRTWLPGSTNSWPAAIWVMSSKPFSLRMIGHKSGSLRNFSAMARRLVPGSIRTLMRSPASSALAVPAADEAGPAPAVDGHAKREAKKRTTQPRVAANQIRHLAKSGELHRQPAQPPGYLCRANFNLAKYLNMESV